MIQARTYTLFKCFYALLKWSHWHEALAISRIQMDPAPSGSLVQIPLCFSSCEKNSPRSCRCTEKWIFFVMGLPSIPNSDNGQEFVNKLIDEVFATCRGIVLMQHHKRILLSDEWLDDLIVTAGTKHVVTKVPSYRRTSTTITCTEVCNGATDRGICTGPQCFRQSLDHDFHNWLWGFNSQWIWQYARESSYKPTEVSGRPSTVPSQCSTLMCSGKVHEELTVVFLLWVFATSLWSGQDPTATSYIQGPMRSHLLSVLLSKNIQPFPIHEVPGAKFSSQERNWFLCTASVVWQTLEQRWFSAHLAMSGTIQRAFLFQKSTSHLT